MLVMFYMKHKQLPIDKISLEHEIVRVCVYTLILS